MKCKYIAEIKSPVVVTLSIGQHEHKQTMSGVYAFNTLRRAEEFQKQIWDETSTAVIITKQQ